MVRAHPIVAAGRRGGEVAGGLRRLTTDLVFMRKAEESPSTSWHVETPSASTLPTALVNSQSSRNL